MLTKEKYFKRRWFLSVLFLLSGLWLIYSAYGMFTYHKNKEELIKGVTIPSKILIEKSESTKNKFVALFLQNKKIGSVIEQKGIEKIIELTGKEELGITNSPVLSNQLTGVAFEYLYWKDKIYELKINNDTIIEFKEEGNYLAYLFLAIGILWTGFQAWVIITLIKKGVSVYDESFKK